MIKLKKKNLSHYQTVKKKIKQICATPKGNYKFLKFNLQKLQRVHVGHYVLIFHITHKNKTIYFEDYDHHDKIYLY